LRLQHVTEPVHRDVRSGSFVDLPQAYMNSKWGFANARSRIFVAVKDSHRSHHRISVRGDQRRQVGGASGMAGTWDLQDPDEGLP